MRGEQLQLPNILDVCCGSRMMWHDRSNAAAIYGDKRSETITVTDRSHGNKTGTRILSIRPDVIYDFRALPFRDGQFSMVVFDPPHLVSAGPRSWLAAKYGKLGADWRDDLRQGFNEAWRVLRTEGTLIFKWNETQVSLKELLSALPQSPLFGNMAGRQNKTHWLAFLKTHGLA